MVMTLSVPTLAPILETGLKQGLSFPELCRIGKGATPIAVRDALLRFDGAATLRDRARRLLLTVGNPHEMRPELDERLPVPHPLDFDWRFTSRTADALAIRALVAAGNRAPILLVGVPSILLAICDRPDRPTIWFASRGKDPITAALKRSAAPGIAFIDIEDDLGSIEAAISIVDPPWYDDIARGMVAKAASGTNMDGEVWVAGPDVLTGLSSAPKLARLDADPSPFGLRHAEVSGFLHYETPPFEMLAFKRNGILNVPPTWRTGRLYRCARAEQVSTSPTALVDGWEERGTYRARIWSRAGGGGADFEVAESRGLSRLDPERAQAVLWTSGHRYSLALPKAGNGSYEDALRELCDHETAVLNDLISWKGRYRVQKNLGGFRLNVL